MRFTAGRERRLVHEAPDVIVPFEVRRSLQQLVVVKERFHISDLQLRRQ